MKLNEFHIIINNTIHFHESASYKITSFLRVNISNCICRIFPTGNVRCAYGSNAWF